MANYPITFDNLPTDHATGQTILASYDNAEASAINAIEAELGLQPSGVYSTVTARLDSIQATYFNVKSPAYGATGDGTTDDTAAILAAETAAAASGGILYFPPGTYLTGPLVAKSNVWYRGAGIGATTLKAKAGATSVIGGSAVSQTNLRISDLTIDGNEAALAVTSYGIALVQYTRIVIDHVRVKNTRNIGIYLYQCIDGLIEGCGIDSIAQTRSVTIDGTQAAINLFGCTRIRVVDNRIDTVNDSGILCGSTTCREITIVGNTIRNPAYIGIALGTTNRAATVTGNTIVGSVEGGIDPGSCISSTIMGNTMIDCGNGIVFDGAVDSICTGNTVNNATGVDSLHFGSGIGAANSKRLVIEGNSVADTYGSGYSFDICDDLLVRGNIAKNCGGTGSAVGTYNGFVLAASGAANRVRFIDNQIIDDRGTPRTGYGISIKPFGSGTLTDVRVVGTVTSGMVTGPVLWNSTVTGYFEHTGSGTPESVYIAPIGSVFHRTNGGAGTSFYVKETGTGNTGWVGK
jgi:nitrous oxidase accessory protein NosD